MASYLQVLGSGHVYVPGILLLQPRVPVYGVELDHTANTSLIVHVMDKLLRHPSQHLLCLSLVTHGASKIILQSLSIGQYDQEFF